MVSPSCGVGASQFQLSVSPLSRNLLSESGRYGVTCGLAEGRQQRPEQAARSRLWSAFVRVPSTNVAKNAAFTRTEMLSGVRVTFVYFGAVLILISLS